MNDDEFLKIFDKAGITSEDIHNFRMAKFGESESITRKDVEMVINQIKEWKNAK